MIAKNFFRFLGFDMRRWRPWSKRISMEDSMRQLRSLKFYPKTIIDVGVAHGTEPLLKIFPSAEYIFIEPLVEFEKNLKKLCKNHKRHYILAAAGSAEGQLLMGIPSEDLSGSYSFSDKDVILPPLTRWVKMITLDSLLSQYNCSDVFLKLDVQGAELKVLEGAKQLLPLCEAVLLEVSLFEFRVGIPQFYAVIKYMKDQDFVVYDLIDGSNRPYDNALGQIDILFVKENGRFRTTHQWS